MIGMPAGFVTLKPSYPSSKINSGGPVCKGPPLSLCSVMNTRHLFFAFSLILWLIQGCGNRHSAQAPMPNMFASLESLASAIVEAVADSNEAKLKSFCVTEQEYRNFVWAKLDPSETNQPGMPVEKAWSWVVRDTEKAARRYVLENGKLELQMTRIIPPKNVKEYPEMKIHRGLRISVTDSGGMEEEWRIANVILEYKGWFKVIAYND